MTKVWCPCAECVHNKDNRCKARELNLAWRNMLTVNEGRQDMWVCRQYELSKESKEILDQLEKLVKK